MTGWFHRKTPENSIAVGSDPTSSHPSVPETTLPSAAPPTPSVGLVASNLPHFLTTFVGRGAELTALKSLVAGSRMVTLTGAGGSGKTRLAREVAASLIDHFPDGAWFVDLAPLTEAELIPPALAATLGIREQPGRTLLATVTEYLQKRYLLVILDNCEHLVDAVARTAEALLAACPQLYLVATSRERLRIEGEHVHQVPPLELPSLDDSRSPAELERCDAVRLFVDRATMALPTFCVTERNASAVADLCGRLDGMPLALELAAAQVGVLTPNEMLARIKDRFRILAAGSRGRLPRQQTLWATLDWSYQLLDEAERILFRRLSVFSGWFDLDAAETVGPGGLIMSTDIPDLMSKLVDKSLVIADEAMRDRSRYRLLETVREYGFDQLRESGEEQDLRRRHAMYFVGDGREKYGIGDFDPEMLDRMEDAHDNARTALSWAVRAEREVACQLAVAWAPYWLERGHYSEGRQWVTAALEGLVERPAALMRGSGSRPEFVSPIVRAQAQFALGQFAFAQADLDGAESHVDEALKSAEGLGDELLIVRLLNGRGAVAGARGDPVAARSYFDRAVTVLTALKDANAQGYPEEAALKLRAGLMGNLGQLDALAGDYASARAHNLMALEGWGHSKGHGWIDTTLNLGELALEDNDPEEARQRFAAALSAASRLRDPVRIADSLQFLAALVADGSTPEQAVRLDGAAVKVREMAGAGALQAYVQSSVRTIQSRIDRARNRLEPSKATEEWAMGHAMSTEEAMDYAFNLMLGESGRVSGNS